MISVIIPHYNDPDSLARVVAAVRAQEGVGEVEIIVADDGSADDSEQVAEEFSDRLAIRYRYQEDRGFRAAEARNMGAAIARAPILVFVDSGTLAGPDLLAGHLRCQAEHRPGPGSPARRACWRVAYILDIQACL